MSGGGGSGNQTVVESNRPWEGAQPFLYKIYDEANDLRKQALLQPYEGPTVAPLRREQYNALAGRQNFLSQGPYQDLINEARIQTHGLMLAGTPSNPAMRAASVVGERMPEFLRTMFVNPTTDHIRRAYSHYDLFMPQEDLRFPVHLNDLVKPAVGPYVPTRAPSFTTPGTSIGSAPTVGLPQAQTPGTPSINIAPSDIGNINVPLPRSDLPITPNVQITDPALGPTPTITAPGVGIGDYGYSDQKPRTQYDQSLRQQMAAGLGKGDPTYQTFLRLAAGQVNTDPFTAATGAAQARTLESFQDLQDQTTEAFRRDVMPALRQEFQQAGTYGGTRHQLAAGRAAERLADEQAQLQTRAQRELADIATNMMMPAYQQAQELSMQAAGLGSQNYFDTIAARRAGAELAMRETLADRERASQDYRARLADQTQRDIARADVGLQAQRFGGELGLDYQRLAEQARQANIGAAIDRGQLGLGYGELGERARELDVTGNLRRGELSLARDELRERARQADVDAQVARANVGLGFGELSERARQADIEAAFAQAGLGTDYAQLRETARQADIDAALGRGQLQSAYQQLRGNLGLGFGELAERERASRTDEKLAFEGMREAARRGDVAAMNQMAALYDSSRNAQRELGSRTALGAYGQMNDAIRTAIGSVGAGLSYAPTLAQMQMAPYDEMMQRGALYRDIDQQNMDRLQALHYERGDLPWQNLWNYASLVQGNPGGQTSSREVSGLGTSQAARALGGALAGGGLGLAGGNALSNAAFSALGAGSGALGQWAAFAPLGPIGLGAGALLGGLGGYYL